MGATSFSEKNNSMHSLQLTSPNKIPEMRTTHFQPLRPEFQVKRNDIDVPGKIPSYIPHYCHTDGCSMGYNEFSCHSTCTSVPSYLNLGIKNCDTYDQYLGNEVVNSQQLTSGLFAENSDTYFTNVDKRDKTASGSAQEPQEKHLSSAKSKIMRKLSLLMERQAKPLALNDSAVDRASTLCQGQGIPELKNANSNKYEDIPKQASGGRSPKFSHNHLPNVSPLYKLPKNVDHCRKEYFQPKSSQKIIANSIKKSFPEPLISPSEDLKKSQDACAKFPSENTCFNFPHSLGQSESVRSMTPRGIQMQDSSVLSTAEKGFGTGSSEMSNFPSGPNEGYPSVNEISSLPDSSVHRSSFNNPHKSGRSVYSNEVDVPTLLERFTLKENGSKSSKDHSCACNEKNMPYSPLRHKTKKPDALLDGPNQRTNVWTLSSSPKNNEDDKIKNPLFMPPVSSTTTFDVDDVLNNSSTREYLGSESPPVKEPVTTEYNSSSSDGELEYRPSLTLKTKSTLRRNRKLAKETKQLVKQEELKRLHKAQAIQRLLEEVEEQQRALEVYGVQLEKELRGEADSRTQDEAQLLHEWFKLVLEKNKLMCYESELLITAKEIEMEDDQNYWRRAETFNGSKVHV